MWSKRPKQVYTKVTQSVQDFQSKVIDKTKFDVPPKKTAYNLTYKDMQEKNKLQGATG